MTVSTIGDLLQRDLDRPIEEVIKVDQLDEHSVHEELSDYVVTKSIKNHYRHVLDAMVDGLTQPMEGVGVWVSGFFGSGKSSFAKNLGYALADRAVLGERASVMLAERIHDERCRDLLKVFNQKAPAEVVMFDVNRDKAGDGAQGNVSVSYFMYRALLRALGYAEKLEIAELEHSLELTGRLEDFVTRFEGWAKGALEANPAKNAAALRKEQWRWRIRRNGAEARNEASAVLHEMDPRTYPTADSWALATSNRDISPAFLVQRSQALMEQRREGRALLFVMDEVGGYVARSHEKIEDLRLVVELFGTQGKNLVKAGALKSPTWIVVTSQEKLDEVVGLLDSKRQELARLQDRFRTRVDLEPSDIREVATRRVLHKTDDGDKMLRALFEARGDEINERLRFERSGRKTEVTATTFADFYPYPPHFIDLSIEIMAGIRLQPGAEKTLGGSNRTIIKQAYEMLATTGPDGSAEPLAKAPVGRMVTLDRVFDLVKGNLASEDQRHISDIEDHYGDAAGWPVRVAKAIALLRFVRNVPRTETNLAAVLWDGLNASAPATAVRAALLSLRDEKYIRYGEDGYSLQSQAEIAWETRRRAIDPTLRERADRLREAVKGIFEDTKLRQYVMKGLRTLTVRVTVDGEARGDGEHIPLHIVSAADLEALAAPGGVRDEAQARSREKEHENELWWAFARSKEIDALLVSIVQSKTMIRRGQQEQSGTEVSKDVERCVANEEDDLKRYEGQLREAVVTALTAGTGLFRGVAREGATLGRDLAEVLRGFFDQTVPQLYAKLAMGAHKLEGSEVDDFLRASNLNGLPQLFYATEGGMSLVVQEDGKAVANPGAPTAKELLDFLRARHRDGTKVTGKDLEQRFGGVGYGWALEVIQLAAAVLLRAGAIEMTFQGVRYTNHQDARSRAAFASKPSFRATTFAPRTSIALKTLSRAAHFYEELEGEEVDIEEGAIAERFKKVAAREANALLPLRATVQAHRLPVDELLGEYEITWQNVLLGASDDCVKILADEGRTIKEQRDRVRRIADAVTPQRLDAIRAARGAVDEMGAGLLARPGGTEVAAEIEELRGLLSGTGFVDAFPRIEALTRRIREVYDEEHLRIEAARDEVMRAEVATIEAMPEWEELDAEARRMLIAPLFPVARARTLSEVESERLAAPGLRAEIAERLRRLVVPSERIERVRLASLGATSLRTEDDVNALVSALRDRLLELVRDGARVIVE